MNALGINDPIEIDIFDVENNVEGIVVEELASGHEREIEGSVILATGHSARDVYRYLHDNGITMEAKGIAVGVRLEHPAQLIDQIQYHSHAGRGKYLPAAEFSFVTQIDGMEQQRDGCRTATRRP